MQTSTAPPPAPSPAALAPATPAASPAARPARRRLRTPTLLRAIAVAAAVLAVVAAAAISATTASRRADVAELASSTAAAATAAGDANAAFAGADAFAAALASPAAPADAELRYLQAMATGVNQLERAAALTNLGDQAEAPIRRVLRTVGSYGAAVDAGRIAAARGDTAAADAARLQAAAFMTDLVRANTAQVAALHDAALRQQADAVHNGRVTALLLILLPLVALLALLALAQLVLVRRFRRLVNVPLVLATVVVLFVTVFVARQTALQTSRLDDAVAGPYTTAQRFTEGRDAAFAERAGHTIDAVRPGSVDVAALTARLSDAVGRLPADGAAATGDAFGRYQASLASPSAADQEAAGAPGTTSSAFNVLDAALLQGRQAAVDEFDAAIASAQERQATLVWLAPLLLAAAAALAWLGLQRRLAEYR